MDVQATTRSTPDKSEQPIEFHKDLIEICKSCTKKWLPRFDIERYEIIKKRIEHGYDGKLGGVLCSMCLEQTQHTQLCISISYVRDTILTQSPSYLICCMEHLFAFYDLFKSYIDLKISADTIFDNLKNNAELLKYNYHSISLGGFSMDDSDCQEIEQAYKILSSCMIHCNELTLDDVYFHNLWNELIPCLLTLLHKEIIKDYVKLDAVADELEKYVEIFNKIGIKCQIPAYDDDESCDIYLYKDKIYVVVANVDDLGEIEIPYSYDSLLV